MTEEVIVGLLENAEHQQATIKNLMSAMETLIIERAQLRDRITDLLVSNNGFEARARAAEREVKELQEWRQNQLVNWPMEIDRRNRDLERAEIEIERLRKLGTQEGRSSTSPNDVSSSPAISTGNEPLPSAKRTTLTALALETSSVDMTSPAASEEPQSGSSSRPNDGPSTTSAASVHSTTGPYDGDYMA